MGAQWSWVDEKPRNKKPEPNLNKQNTSGALGVGGVIFHLHLHLSGQSLSHWSHCLYPNPSHRYQAHGKQIYTPYIHPYIHPLYKPLSGNISALPDVTMQRLKLKTITTLRPCLKLVDTILNLAITTMRPRW